MVHVEDLCTKRLSQISNMFHNNFSSYHCRCGSHSLFFVNSYTTMLIFSNDSYTILHVIWIVRLIATAYSIHLYTKKQTITYVMM